MRHVWTIDSYIDSIFDQKSKWEEVKKCFFIQFHFYIDRFDIWYTLIGTFLSICYDEAAFVRHEKFCMYIKIEEFIFIDEGRISEKWNSFHRKVLSHAVKRSLTGHISWWTRVIEHFWVLLVLDFVKSGTEVDKFPKISL